MQMFGFCTSVQEEPGPSNAPLPAPDDLRRWTSQGSFAPSQQSEITTPQFSSIHRLSLIPTLPSNEPLELLALTNEAILDRDALLACKRIAELCKDMSTLWLREQVAQCLARAMLVFGDVFPYTSKFPPLDSLFLKLNPDEHVMLAIVVHDERISEILSPNSFDVVLDGLESYPITFFRAQPPSQYTNEFHAEAVMLCSVEAGETIHLQDNRPQMVTNSSGSLGRRGRQSCTYYARRLHEDIVAVVCFPKSQRDINDLAVGQFLDKLSRLFVL